MIAESLKKLYDIKAEIKSAVEYLYPDMEVSDDFASYAQLIRDYQPVETDYSDYALVLETNNPVVRWYRCRDTDVYYFSGAVTTYTTDNYIKELDYSHFDGNYKNIAPSNSEATNVKYMDYYKITDNNSRFFIWNELPNLNHIDELKTDGCVSLYGLFSYCKIADLSNLTIDFSGVTNAVLMFCHCDNLTKFPQMVNMGDLTDADSFYRQCTALTDIDCSIFREVTQVRNLNYMFYGCSKLINADLSGFENMTMVDNISYMFYGCSKLETINFGEWRLETDPIKLNVFQNCSSLRHITCTQNMYEILRTSSNFKNIEDVTWYIIDAEPEEPDYLIKLIYPDNVKQATEIALMNTNNSWSVLGTTDEDGILLKDSERDNNPTNKAIGFNQKQNITEAYFDINDTSFVQVNADGISTMTKLAIYGNNLQVINFKNNKALQTVVFPDDCSEMSFENNVISGCSILENFENLNILKAQALDISTCSKLSWKSIYDFLSALMPTMINYIINLGNRTNESDEFNTYIALATEKGYTISY